MCLFVCMSLLVRGHDQNESESCYHNEFISNKYCILDSFLTETNRKEQINSETSKISPCNERSKVIWRKCWSLDLEDESQSGTNTQKSDDNIHFVEKLKNNSRNFKMILRKCSSLDETMKETKAESDPENSFRRQGKGRNLINKIKRSSSSMLNSIEDEFSKGKTKLTDCQKLFPLMYSDIIIFASSLPQT